MTAGVSRRGFLSGALAAGGVLSLGVTFGCGPRNGARIAHADQTGELDANMYITVQPDGRVALRINKCEIGQGVTTAYCTLVAEDLGVGVDQIDATYADSYPEYRTSFRMHATGGSTSTKEGYVAMRHAAASARDMLIAAAAHEWGVRFGECTAAGGKVSHAASGKSAGYGELTRLAAHQDVPHAPRLKPKSEFTVIGKHDRRVDARAKVTGAARFGIDTDVPDAVHAVVIHPPVYGARATHVDDAAARKRPGVIDVFAFADGVAVVAAKHWQALAASRDVAVTWGKGAVAGLDTAKMQAAMRAYGEHGTTVADHGNANKAIEHAHARVDAIYEAPYLAHACMEPQNCVVSVHGKQAEVWAPIQIPTVAQAYVADAIGGDMDDVMVHTTLAGGGFGRRGLADVCAQAARISKQVKRPVHLVWTRESDMTQGFYRPVYAVHMAGGVTGDGRPSGVRAHVVSQAITLSSRTFMGAAMGGVPNAVRGVVTDALLAMFSTNSMGDIFAAEGLKETPYRYHDYHVEFTPVQNQLPVAAWRSVGNSMTGFAAESFVDELAHAAGKDPLAFRLAMLDPKGKQRRVLDALAELSGWGTAPPPGVGRGLARHFAFETEVGEVADVEIVDGRIRVRKVYCVVDCGIAVNPDLVRAQMEGAIIFGLSAALDQQITLVDGVVQETNYDTFPLLRMFEAPEIVVKVLDSDHAPTGVGEPGLPPIAPAVANAIFAATGVRLRRMPLQRAWDEQAGRKS